jgi:hypothetical protein
MARHSLKPVVLITCPTSGELVPTGVLARELEELPAVNVLLGCERCGEDHEWFQDEAVITATSH